MMSIQEKQLNNRNIIIDIMKGICIIFVVLGHTYNNFFHDFIYLFHVAIFYVLAGYCYNMKYTENLSTVVQITKKRIISLWIPYFSYNLIFLLLQNFFLKIGLLTSNELYFSYNPMLNDGFVKSISFRDSILIIIKSFFFMGTRPFCGALWFLGGLFYITIFYTCLGYLLKKLKWFPYIRICISILFLIIGYLIISKGINVNGIKKYVGLILITDFPFSLGVFLKSNNFYGIKITIRRNIILFICSLLGLLVLVQFGTISIGSVRIVNPIFYIVAIVAGISFVFSISYFIMKLKITSKLFSVIGQHTMPILALHTFAFKIVTFMQYKIYNADSIVISLFPVWHSELVWAILYTIIGVSIPLLLAFFLGKNKILKKIFKL